MLAKGPFVAMVGLVCLLPGLAGQQSETMRFAPAPSGEIAFHVLGDGSGTLLMLVNGGPGFDHRYLHLSPTWERLGSARPVIFFDQPGTGQSYPIGPSDTVAVQEVLEAVRAIIDALGGTRVAVLGHSWGGYLAMALALDYRRSLRAWFSSARRHRTGSTPSSTSGLSSRTPSPGGPTPAPTPRVFRGPAPAPGHVVLLAEHPADRPERLHRVAVQRVAVRAPDSRRDGARPVGRPSRPSGTRARGYGPVRRERGSPDVLAGHQAIPGSRFVVWERSGHYPMIEEPDRFAEVVATFLEGLRP